MKEGNRMMTVLFWVGLLIALAIGFDWEGDDGMVVAGIVYVLGFHVYRMGRKLAVLERKMALLDDVLINKQWSLKESTASSENRDGQRDDPDFSVEDLKTDRSIETFSSDGPPPLPDEPMDEPVYLKSERVINHEPPLKTIEPAENPMRHVHSVAGVEQKIRDFFTTGNVVVKIGWVILFFGVGFLLKFASDRNMFPVEARYIAIVAGASALLWFGWILRTKSKDYALLLQGGAIGLLYMTVFAAAKIHSLIPMEFAGLILVSLVIFSGMLAVIQNARLTAVFGAAGGFLAPVLTSTGSGSHVMLFSYYALLNCGILGIAWFKSWRELNLVGFLFTFGIGSLWGLNAYSPEYFRTTEPFLILFFLFFFMISILFAVKQPEDRKGYVDGSLVFGLPVICFTLQGYLVKDTAFGLALSAVSLSLFYLLTAKILWGKQSRGLRTLIESFLALGVVFGSLAIPLSLDGRWTSAAWAMEGAALIWVGVRQERLKARFFGLLLQGGAGISFLLVMDAPSRNVPLINGFYLGCLALSLSGFFSSYVLQKNTNRLRLWEWNIHWAAMVWGIAWWCGAGVSEIRSHVPDVYRLSALVTFSGLSVWISMLIYGKSNWPALKYPLFCLSGVLTLLLIGGGPYGLHFQAHPFEYYGWAAWLFSLSVFYLSMYRYGTDLDSFWTAIQHLVGYLLVVALVCMESAYIMELVSGTGSVWATIVWGFMPALFILFICARGHAVPWPLGRYETNYKGFFQIPVMVFLLFWFLATGWSEPGIPSPLPYIPVINPVEIVQLLCILVFLYWFRALPQQEWGGTWGIQRYWGTTLSAVLGFFWMNTVIGRSVHVFTAIPFDWELIWRSMVFQASVSVAWTCLALVCMIMARNRQNRVLWFTGACLLGIVVIKLFIIDLSNSRAIARIVSFLVTGILMLIVGFFSPLPPRPMQENAKEHP